MPGPARTTLLSPWGRLVLVSAVVVVGFVAVLGVWALASRETRTSVLAVRGALQGVRLDVDDADVLVVRGPAGRQSVGVERVDRFTFDHAATITKTVRGGVFALRSRCPGTMFGDCSVRFRVTVPDNLPIVVRTTTGDVTLQGYRGSARVVTTSGTVRAEAFCGFSLDARTQTGDVDAGASCAPQRLSLRSSLGDVRAVVPPGRYEIDADTAGGTERVQGLTAAASSPFVIQVLSSAGDVSVEAGP